MINKEIILLTPNFSHLHELSMNFSKQNTIMTDEMVFRFEKKTVFFRDQRGQYFNPKNNAYSGQISDIKDVYFLRGAQFDRSYFRRLYKDVNVRKFPENADVILYDERSMFENDTLPETITIFTFNDKTYGFLHSKPRIVGEMEWRKTQLVNSHFPPNRKECEITNFLISNTVLYTHKKIGNPIDYFINIQKSGKPFLHIQDFFNSRDSSARSDNMTYSDFLAMAEQLSSNDPAIRNCGIETLIQYNPKKYLALQSFLIFMTSVKEEDDFNNSAKYRIFYQSSIRPWIPNNLSYSSQGGWVTKETDSLTRVYKTIYRINSWYAFYKDLFSDQNIDLDFIKELIYSNDVFYIFEKEKDPQINSQIFNPLAASPLTHFSKNFTFDSNIIFWSLEHDRLKNTNPKFLEYVNKQEKNQEVSECGIDSFCIG